MSTKRTPCPKHSSTKYGPAKYVHVCADCRAMPEGVILVSLPDVAGSSEGCTQCGKLPGQYSEVHDAYCQKGA